MTLGVTIARKGTTWGVVFGPEIDFADQRRGFHGLCEELRGTHDEVQLISSASGRVKRRRLKEKLVVSPEGSKVEGDKESSNGKELI